MSGKRIGERLSSIVPLSGHDIEEILSEQGSTGRRFGEIAIQLGLASAENVIRAWSTQLAEHPQHIELDSYHFDHQALNVLPREQALKFHIMPLRVLDDGLVVAIDEAAYAETSRRLNETLRLKLQYVFSSHAEISRALREHYSTTAA